MASFFNWAYNHAPIHNNNNYNNILQSNTNSNSPSPPTQTKTFHLSIPNQDEDATVESICFTSDGLKLFLSIARDVREGEIVVWDASTQEIDFIIPHDDSLVRRLGFRNRTIVSPNDELFIIGFDRHVQVWDIHHKYLKMEINLQQPWTGMVEISCKSSFALLGGFQRNTMLRILDMKTDGRILYEIHLPSSKHQQLQQQMTGIETTVGLNCCISSDETMIAVGTDRVIHVFSLIGENSDIPRGGQLLSSFAHSLPQAPSGFWFSFNPTNHYLVTRGGRSSIVQVWSLEGEKLWDLKHDNVLVTTQSQRTPFPDGLLTADLMSRVHLWDLRTGRRVFSFGLSDINVAPFRGIGDLGISNDLNRGFFVVQNHYYSLDLSQRFLFPTRQVMKEFLHSRFIKQRVNLDIASRIATFLAEVEVVVSEDAIQNGHCFNALLLNM
jgi:WD40 repeat protein